MTGRAVALGKEGLCVETLCVCVETARDVDETPASANVGAIGCRRPRISSCTFTFRPLLWSQRGGGVVFDRSTSLIRKSPPPGPPQGPRRRPARAAMARGAARSLQEYLADKKTPTPQRLS